MSLTLVSGPLTLKRHQWPFRICPKGLAVWRLGVTETGASLPNINQLRELMFAYFDSKHFVLEQSRGSDHVMLVFSSGIRQKQRKKFLDAVAHRYGH